LALSEARKKGWVLDNVGDLARVVRLPGTYNVKTQPAKLATVLERSGKRYSIEALEAYIPALPKADQTAPNFFKASETAEAQKTSPDFVSIYSGCAFIRHCVDDAKSLV
jgi:putative DNA primase/helicase